MHKSKESYKNISLINIDYNQHIHLTLAVYAEQLVTINHLLGHYNWTYREISKMERHVLGSSHANVTERQTF